MADRKVPKFVGFAGDDWGKPMAQRCVFRPWSKSKSKEKHQRDSQERSVIPFKAFLFIVQWNKRPQRPPGSWRVLFVESFSAFSGQGPSSSPLQIPFLLLRMPVSSLSPCKIPSMETHTPGFCSHCRWPDGKLCPYRWYTIQISRTLQHPQRNWFVVSTRLHGNHEGIHNDSCLFGDGLKPPEILDSQLVSD